MIRVNLLKNKVGDTAMSPGLPAIETSHERREMITKIVLLLVFTLGLMIYESQNIRALDAELQRLQGQSQELEAEKQAKLKELDAYKDIEQQARELEDKLKLLKLLSRLRLREVKTLDFVQSAIPEKVWLKSMTYEADSKKFEQGHFDFIGNAVSTEDLSEFVKRLENSNYLYQVIVVKNQETPIANSKSTLRDFQFTAQVEAKP